MISDEFPFRLETWLARMSHIQRRLHYLTSYAPEVFLSISSDYLFIGTNTSECVYDGEGYILVHLQSLMGSVRGEYSRLISLTFMSMI